MNASELKALLVRVKAAEEARRVAERERDMAVEIAVKALRPFAEIADAYRADGVAAGLDDGFPGSEVLYGYDAPNLGHFRLAASTLSALSGEENQGDSVSSASPSAALCGATSDAEPSAAGEP